MKPIWPWLDPDAERVERTDLVAAEAADGEHFEAGIDRMTRITRMRKEPFIWRKRAELATRRGCSAAVVPPNRRRPTSNTAPHR